MNDKTLCLKINQQHWQMLRKDAYEKETTVSAILRGMLQARLEAKKESEKAN